MPDPFLLHEALDRCHLINCLLDDQLLAHPAIGLNLEVYEKLRKASDLLGDAYIILCHEQDKVLEAKNG